MSTPHVHIYRSPHEPATRFDLGAPSGESHIVTRPGHSLVWTECCAERRWAANCTVQVYYDSIRFWCRDGKGCKTDFWKRRAEGDQVSTPIDRAREAARMILYEEVEDHSCCGSMAHVIGSRGVKCQEYIREVEIPRIVAVLLRFAAGDVEAEAREAGARFEHMDVVSYVEGRRALAAKVEGGE